MLLWDAWGLADERSTEQHDLELLDHIALVTASPNPAPADLRELYNRDPRLRVPASIRSYDPLGGPPRDVSLRSFKAQSEAAS